MAAGQLLGAGGGCRAGVQGGAVSLCVAMAAKALCKLSYRAAKGGSVLAVVGFPQTAAQPGPAAGLH